MNIEFKKQDVIHNHFSDLLIGEVFTDWPTEEKTEVYMKITKVKTTSEADYNAVNLENGTFRILNIKATVCPLDVTLVVEP